MKYKFIEHYKYNFIFQNAKGEKVVAGGDYTCIYKACVTPIMTLRDIKYQFGEDNVIKIKTL